MKQHKIQKSKHTYTNNINSDNTSNLSLSWSSDSFVFFALSSLSYVVIDLSYNLMVASTDEAMIADAFKTVLNNN